MDWGKGIALFIVAFIIFMGTMVYKSVNQKFYLVTENYYTEGINYDKVQEKIKNEKALEHSVEFNQKDGKININMPTEVKGGTVHFFRPSDGSIDFQVPIVAKEFYIDKTKMKTGKWIMKFSWTDGVKEYYIEKSISVL